MRWGLATRRWLDDGAENIQSLILCERRILKNGTHQLKNWGRGVYGVVLLCNDETGRSVA